MSDEATRKQTAPTGNGDSVTMAVVKDLLDRSEIGAKKYGTILRTHNGREALVDAYQEVLDLAQYIKQAIMEGIERASNIRALPTLELVAISNLCAEAVLADVEATDRAKAQAQSVKDGVPKASPTTTLHILQQTIQEINSRRLGTS